MKYSAKEIQRILDENRGPEVYTLNTVSPEETDEYKEYQRYLRFYECKKVKKQLRANPDLIVTREYVDDFNSAFNYESISINNRAVLIYSYSLQHAWFHWRGKEDVRIMFSRELINLYLNNIKPTEKWFRDKFGSDFTLVNGKVPDDFILELANRDGKVSLLEFDIYKDNKKERYPWFADLDREYNIVHSYKFY